MALNTSPYSQLPEAAFWNPSVANKNALQISGLWLPRFEISQTDTIATAGSCFAQHISKAMQARGYNWFDSEPAPASLEEADHKDFNYGIFSFRTGNIYTVALLKQWLSWALGSQKPEDIEIWQTEDGRFIDPFRPNIVPGGFVSKAELIAARAHTFKAIKTTFEQVDIFVFTLGLTEAWINTDSGCVYPMCPGTLAGEFDASKHQFVNYQYPEIRKALRETMEMAKKLNPSIRFLLTVSPVPLTATASGQHVLTATTHSKSVLRAVAGDIAQTRADTDYFPSYEIISSFPFRGMFYQANQRSVAPEGVDFVMNSFFECQRKAFEREETTLPNLSGKAPAALKSLDELDEAVCEDALLDAFSTDKRVEAPDTVANSDAQKVCLIGSSHLGVVRQAWSRDFESARPDIKLTFFGVPGSGLNKVFVVGNTAKSDDEKVIQSFITTSGGLTEINLLEYDIFILHGLGFPLKSLQAFLQASPAQSPDETHGISQEELGKFIQNAIAKDKIIALARALRKASNAPIHISAAPMWSALERDTTDDKYGRIRDTGSFIKNAYWSAIKEHFAVHEISLITQPEQTVEDTYFTKEIYTMGYSSGNIRDYGHMNVKYGGLAIREMLKRMDQNCSTNTD